MRCETVILLTYYYRQEDRDHRMLRHIIGAFCPTYLPFDLHLYDPLKRMFRRVIVYDFLRRRAELGLKAMNDEVLALVREERPKYVLWTSFYDDIRNITLEAIRKEGATVVGWFFDDEWRFSSYSKYWIPYLDYCVTNAISVVPRYRQLGARVIQTVPNSGVTVDVDWAHLEEGYDLAFVGSTRTADRRRYLDEFRINNTPVNVFGEGHGGYVPFERMLDIFRTSRINLNFSKAGSYPWVRQIKGRVFQVCLAGGFLLTEYSLGLEKYFEPGKEVVSFNSPRDMINKARYYLNHEAERRAIARAGWERANMEYSSSRMVARVFEEIEEDLARRVRGSDSAARLKMTIQARKVFARYHQDWGSARIQEDDRRNFWEDDLALALSYVPWSIFAWLYRILGLLPLSVRFSVFSRLRRLENRRLGITALHWITFRSFVRRMIEGFLRKSQ